MRLPFVVTAFAIVVAALCSFPATARADGAEVADRAPGRVTIPVVVIHGRVQRPLVVVDVRQPTAAHEAAAAHETLREAWMQASVPATLRGTGW